MFQDLIGKCRGAVVVCSQCVCTPSFLQGASFAGTSQEMWGAEIPVAVLDFLCWLLPHHSGLIITSTQPITVQESLSNPIKSVITAKPSHRLPWSKLVAVTSFSLMTLLLQRGQTKEAGERAVELKTLLCLCSSRKLFKA